jgi:hypothetical protein
MGTDAKRLGIVALCSLSCFLCPIAIALLSQTYAYDRLPSENDYQSWPLYTIDTLFWVDVCFTVVLIWSMRGRRWLVALVAVSLLALTCILTVFGGMWVEGTYF